MSPNVKAARYINEGHESGNIHSSVAAAVGQKIVTIAWYLCQKTCYIINCIQKKLAEIFRKAYSLNIHR
jgi:hypothetical protein